MGWKQKGGEVGGLPVAELYFRIGKQEYCSFVEQVHRTDGAGNRLDIHGNPVVPLESGGYPDGTEFSYVFEKKMGWTITVHGYLSRNESEEFRRAGKNPRKIIHICFNEPQGGMFPINGDPQAAIYAHPEVVRQVPSDWEAFP